MVALLQSSFHWFVEQQFVASYIAIMPRRHSPRDIQEPDDLSSLDRIVTDKRLHKRTSAKKSRRNRHYEKQFLRNALMHRLASD